MSSMTLSCDQAIFTSIRSPMGEGYRIVAASRGLRADERQVITRYSPSHDSLCWPPPENPEETASASAVAFYQLPGGRFCVALSCYAGVEHTGRGGHRVYTHNVVCDKAQLANCTHNPFAIVRAMYAAGLHVPELRPSPVLSELELAIENATSEARNDGHAGIFDTREGNNGSANDPYRESANCLSLAWRGYVLQGLLEGRSLVVNLTEHWTEVAETVLLGLPITLREALSFSAGLRFSIGRCHRLLLLHDDQGVTRSRLAGRKVEYVDPTAAVEPEEKAASSWVAFVARHWKDGDLTTLLQRTSRTYSDVSPAGCDRIGRLYSEIDAVPNADLSDLLRIAASHFNEPERGAETDLAAQLVVSVQRALLEQLRGRSWPEISPDWAALCALQRDGAEARLFVRPLLHCALEAAARNHPVMAAEAAIELARNLPSAQAPGEKIESLAELHLFLEDLLGRVADWADCVSDEQLSALAPKGHSFTKVVEEWQNLRPQCRIVRRLQNRCTRLAPVRS